MAMVKDLFPSNALLPFQQVVGGTDGTAGPQKLSIVTLSDLADSIVLSGDTAAAASQARPNPLANITSFVTTIKEQNKNLKDQYAASANADHRKVRRDVLTDPKLDTASAARYVEWSALSAAVALRGVYSMCGLNITMKPEELDGEQYLFDKALLFSMHQMSDAYRFMVDRVDPTNGRPLGGKLFYLYQNDKPFAIYSDEIGVCPIMNYDKQLFAGLVPWHKPMESADEHNCWADPLSLDQGEYVENRYIWWMVKNGYPEAVGQAAAGNPLPLYDQFATRQGVTGNDSTTGWQVMLQTLEQLYTANYPQHAGKAATFCTVCGGYLKEVTLPGHAEPTVEARVLPLFFTPKLLLAQKKAAGEPCGLGYNDKAPIDAVTNPNPVGWQSLKLVGDEATRQMLPSMDRLVPVVPFTEAAAQLHGVEFELYGLTFKVYAKQTQGVGKIDRIDMHATLRFTDVQPQSFSFVRSYTAQEIVSGLLPYLTVWPWVALPKNVWKNFYATQKASDADYEPMHGVPFSGKLNLQITEGESFAVQEFGNPNAADEQWNVVRNDKRFRYAVVKNASGATAGIVFVKEVQDYDVTDINLLPTYALSVDFGTTSTVCAIRDAGGNIIHLPYLEYGCNVTIGDEDEDMTPVAERRWLGRSKPTTGETLLQRKTLSVAQLFDGNGPGNGQFLSGRFFLATSSQLCGYTARGSFGSQQIYNDLKLSVDNRADQQRAAQLYLAGVYTQALLYVLSRHGRIGELYSSYPSSLTLGALQSCWAGASNLINGNLVGGSASPYRMSTSGIQYCTEADAAYRYNRDRVPGVRYLSVDIGGGTTDVTLVGAGVPEDHSLSVKYAGREIIVNSFIQAYRRWADDAGSVAAKQHFTRIWGNALDQTWDAAHAARVRNDLIEEFFRQCPKNVNSEQLLNVVDDESLRMIVEILLNDFDMVMPADGGEYNLFRSIITAKFFMLMHLVARFMAKNKEWLLERANVIPYRNERYKMITIAFTGTAAMTLMHVFNTAGINVLDSQDSLGGRMPGPISQMLSKVAAMISAEMGEPIAIKLAIGANVREKEEVAYGMLQPVAAGADVPAADIIGLPTVDVDTVMELLYKMDEQDRFNWWLDEFNYYIGTKEQVQDALEFEPIEKLTDYANSLRTKSNEKQVAQVLDDLMVNNFKPDAPVGSLIKSVASLIRYWSAVTDQAGNAGVNTWPVQCAPDTNLGLNGKTSLSSILPRGQELSPCVQNAVQSLQKDAVRTRYLVSVDDAEYRNSLLLVYVIENIINMALRDRQVQ